MSPPLAVVSPAPLATPMAASCAPVIRSRNRLPSVLTGGVMLIPEYLCRISRDREREPGNRPRRSQTVSRSSPSGSEECVLRQSEYAESPPIRRANGESPATLHEADPSPERRGSRSLTRAAGGPIASQPASNPQSDRSGSARNIKIVQLNIYWSPPSYGCESHQLPVFRQLMALAMTRSPVRGTLSYRPGEVASAVDTSSTPVGSPSVRK